MTQLLIDHLIFDMLNNVIEIGGFLLDLLSD